MKITENKFPILILAVILITTGVIAAENTPEGLLKQYIATLADHQTSSVDSFWVSDDIDRSRNLGITFTGIENKIDCASPLVYNYKYLRCKPAKQNIRIESIDTVTARGFIDIRCPDGDSITCNYYLANEDGNWRLCSSLYLYTGDWYIAESKYFKIIFTDSSLINNYAIEALDNFTDSLAEILEIPGMKMEYLNKHKIEYYLCTPDQMTLLTGYGAHGMVSFPFDAIITRHLPHPHEITHLIINYAFGEAPLFTLPLIQEGVACCLGGRWGKSPKIINYWGAAIENLDLIGIDSLLTVTGFYSCPVGVDGSYAVSALLVNAIIKNYGFGNFKQIFLALSGDEGFVPGLSSENIKSIISNICNAKWEVILNTYDTGISANLNCGIFINQQFGNTAINNELSGNGFKVLVNEDSTKLHFAVEIKSDSDKGIILFNDSNNRIYPGYSSWQYEEQTGNDYSSEIRYGLCFDKNEIGLYDYYTNTLLAKYVYGFTPMDGFWNDSTKTINFSLASNLFEKSIDDYTLSMDIRK